MATLLIGAGHAATADALPNPQLTPGAVISTDRNPACAWGHTQRLYERDHQAYEIQARSVYRDYEIPYNRHRDYELDHLVPRCLGGADETANLWPQPLAEARRKDQYEWIICRAVCRAGTMTLDDGQAFFRDGKWQ